MRGEVGEVGVRREQLQLVTDTELREESVDRADLYASPAGTISDLRCLEVIVAVGRNEWQGGKARDDRFVSTRSTEALEQLLIDESSRHHELASGQGSLQGAHLGESCRRIAAERKRPTRLCRRRGSIARALLLVVVRRVPVELTKQFEDPALFATGDELAEG